MVLFSGGKGVTRITKSGEFRSGTGNFLIRTRTDFFSGVLRRWPSTRRRIIPAICASDFVAVIAHLRGHFGLPIWLVRTSRGVTSVVSGGSQLDVHRPDGIVLTSSMPAPVTKDNHVFDFSLEKLSIPALITHH